MLSYAVSGEANELFLYNYKNFIFYMGNAQRYYYFQTTGSLLTFILIQAMRNL